MDEVLFQKGYNYYNIFITSENSIITNINKEVISRISTIKSCIETTIRIRSFKAFDMATKKDQTEFFKCEPVGYEFLIYYN